jgi:uncharacterized protein YjdB
MKLVALAAVASLLLTSCFDPFGAFTNLVDSTNKIPVTGISISASTKSIEIGETVQLSASVSPPSATIKTVAWSSSAPAIAAVSNTGLVTGVAVGVKSSATIFVTLSERLVPVIAPPNAADQRISWASSDPSKATVSGDETVTGVAAGQATITVTTRDGNKSANCTVTVVPVLAAGIVLDRSTASINVWEELQLSANFSPADATDRALTWTSGASGIANVSASGLVSGIADGDATITATTVDGGFIAVLGISVNIRHVTGVQLDYSQLSIDRGGTGRFGEYYGDIGRWQIFSELCDTCHRACDGNLPIN